MMILYVLLIVVLGAVVYIFFAPFYVEIDSTRNLYRFRFHRLIYLDLKIGNELTLEMSALGWKKEFKSLPETENRDRKKKSTEIKKADRGMPPVKKIVRILRSFQLTKCHVRFDSGDMQLNGILFPVFAWLNWYSHRDIQISFTGTNTVVLEIKNNLARVSRAWFGSD